MSLVRSGSHRRTPFLMLLVGLALTGARARLEAGSDDARFAVKGHIGARRLVDWRMNPSHP